VEEYNFKQDGKGFCIGFVDITLQRRTVSDLSAMIGGMRELANKYGFDLRHWGNLSTTEEYFEEIISRKKAVEDSEE
jgi:hypothetical protein